MVTDVLIQVLSGSVAAYPVRRRSGLTLIFGVLRIANFAHGSFFMIAAFISYSMTKAVGSSNLGFLASLVVAPLAIAASAPSRGGCCAASPPPHLYS